MRPLTIALLATCLLGTSTVPAIAQDPSPPPWFGGRVEMPEYGIAITLPDNWLGFDLTGDVPAQIQAVTDFMGDVFPKGATHTSADLQRRGERYELLGVSLDSQSCELEVVWSGGSDPRDPALYRRIDALFGPEPGFEGYTGVHPVDLPGGPAITYGWVQVGSGPEGQGMSHASYLIGGPDRDAALTCEGPDRPADHWLSIAETFEFLPPVDPASLADPAAPWLGGRVEMHNRDFALDLPEGWVGIDTAADLETQLASVAASFDPVQCGQCEEAVYDGLTRMVAAGVMNLVVIDLMTESTCGVGLGDNRTDTTLDVLADALFEAYSADPRATEVTLPVETDLPGGAAVRIGMSMTDPTMEGSYLPSTAYVMLADDRYLLAVCSAYQRPEDDWLSIAETFEFLPAEE